MLSHILFILYLVIFGALIFTIIKAPSITPWANQLNKETGMINLLFEIDVCFAMFRKVCKGSQFNKKNKLEIRTKQNNQIGSKETSEENNIESRWRRWFSRFVISVTNATFTIENIGEHETHDHDLLLGSINGLRNEIESLQSQITLLQKKMSEAQ